MNWTELTSLLPIGIVLTTALAVVFLQLSLAREDRYLLPWVALTGCILAVAAIFQGEFAHTPWFLSFDKSTLGGVSPLKLGGAFCVDGFALAIWIVALLAGGLSILSAPPRHGDDSALSSGEFYGLTLLAVAGMMLLSAAHDFLTLLISLEIMSIATYILAGSRRDSVQSNEAALKYLVLGAFATAFLLLGIAFYYGGTGGLSLAPSEVLAKLAQMSAEAREDAAARQTFVLAGLGLIIAGACFKIGATPFHFWIPDVYEGAPTAVTGLMAAGVKAAAFAVLARLACETFGAPEFRPWLNQMLVIAAVLTMAVGNIFAMRQTNVKRMLAYSGIAHTGYLLLGLLLSPAHSGDGAVLNEHAKAIAFYLLTYGVMTLGAFGVVSLVRKDGARLEQMKSFRGLAKEHPAAALCMAAFLLSLAGLPPLGGFFAKFLIFRDAVAEGYVVAAVLGILTSVASLYYYLRVVVEMYMSPANEEARAGEAAIPAASCDFEWPNGLLIYGAGIVTLVLGLAQDGSTSWSFVIGHWSFVLAHRSAANDK